MKSVSKGNMWVNVKDLSSHFFSLNSRTHFKYMKTKMYKMMLLHQKSNIFYYALDIYYKKVIFKFKSLPNINAKILNNILASQI